MKSSIHRWLRRIWIVCGLSFLTWQFWSMRATGVDTALLTSSSTVTVLDSGEVLQFIPARATPQTPGLIFLPGAMVEPAAYVPLLRAVADAGHPAILVRLPWRAAPSVSSRTVVWQRIAAVRAGGTSRPWVLGGHSRGAALAAGFVGEHADAFRSLVLVGTTHPKAASLAGVSLDVTKIYGTRDCVADAKSILANARLLPPGAHFVRLDGANHAQFGWYGTQLGDCAATMPRATQHVQTLEAVLAVLQRARPEK